MNDLSKYRKSFYKIKNDNPHLSIQKVANSVLAKFPPLGFAQHRQTVIDMVNVFGLEIKEEQHRLDNPEKYQEVPETPQIDVEAYRTATLLERAEMKEMLALQWMNLGDEKKYNALMSDVNSIRKAAKLNGQDAGKVMGTTEDEDLYEGGILGMELSEFEPTEQNRIRQQEELANNA